VGLKHVVKRLAPPVVVYALRWLLLRDSVAARQYIRAGGAPWSRHYDAYHRRFITSVLADDTFLRSVGSGALLPPGYGIGVDERCVEYPWLVSHLATGPERLLDAGSTLNHAHILEHPVFQGKLIDILTLSPEENCFWSKGISYLFHDLRRIPFRDNYYDEIACISTLEHVGCDNSSFTNSNLDREDKPRDFTLAMTELHRVLKPGGTLFLTVPFGLYRHFGLQQQFDRGLLSAAVEAFGTASNVTEEFFRYSEKGWNRASDADCSECAYVEWITQAWMHGRMPRPVPVEQDRAAAARSVACVRLVKAG
jgi:SAM-dependent methyltransferase